MKEQTGVIALIAGARGALSEDLARELASGGRRVLVLGRDPRPERVDVLFYLDGPEDDGPVEAAIAAAAEAAEPAAGLKQVILLGTERPCGRKLAVEDALRYLATRRGAALTVLRAGPEAFGEPQPARRFAALAVSASQRDASGAAALPRAKPLVVLLTGAAGLVGRAMGRLLDENGIVHRGTDIVPAPSDLGAPYHQCDLADPQARTGLAAFCAPVTHVIHLASKITNEKSLAASYLQQHRLNVAGTLNLVAALPPAVRHLSYASSITVYGSTTAAAVDESQPARPNCVYALTKLAAERLLLESSARTGLKIALLRYTSAYGPGPATGRAITNMICRLLDGQPPEIYGDGSTVRDYIYIDDLCRATLKASLREAEGVLNVGTGVGISAADLARLLVRLTGASVAPVRSPRLIDAQAGSSLVYDISKMRRELGFSPEVSLEEGLLRTIRHFQAARTGRPAP
jgi:UDP-glucose 4-epimerase